jgi:hypothetical protein
MELFVIISTINSHPPTGLNLFLSLRAYLKGDEKSLYKRYLKRERLASVVIRVALISVNARNWVNATSKGIVRYIIESHP